MRKINFKAFSVRLACGLFAFALLTAYIPNIASAAQLTGRQVIIGSSIASASTTYQFVFTAPSATIIKSASFVACTTASGACTPAPGFSASSSSLTQQPTGMGDATGWMVSTATAGELRLSNSTNATTRSGSQNVYFSGVVNPSATNSTFFIRMNTFSDANWTTLIDSGTVASSTAGLVTVTASVDETLTFTLGTANVALGTLTSGTTGKGTSTMSVATNAATGYSISYKPTTTLASGSNNITALTAGGASATGTPQFGINLVSNTTPAVGANVSGAGTGTASAGYNTSNSFKFDVSGGTVAQASIPTNSNTYTASYIANISDITPPGAYSTNITYVATANF